MDLEADRQEREEDERLRHRALDQMTGDGHPHRAASMNNMDRLVNWTSEVFGKPKPPARMYPVISAPLAPEKDDDGYKNPRPVLRVSDL